MCFCGLCALAPDKGRGVVRLTGVPPVSLVLVPVSAEQREVEADAEQRARAEHDERRLEAVVAMAHRVARQRLLIVQNPHHHLKKGSKNRPWQESKPRSSARSVHFGPVDFGPVEPRPKWMCSIFYGTFTLSAAQNVSFSKTNSEVWRKNTERILSQGTTSDVANLALQTKANCRTTQHWVSSVPSVNTHWAFDVPADPTLRPFVELFTWKMEAAAAFTNETAPQFRPKCFTPYRSPTNAGTTLIWVPTAAKRHPRGLGVNTQSMWRAGAVWESGAETRISQTLCRNWGNSPFVHKQPSVAFEIG